MPPRNPLRRLALTVGAVALVAPLVVSGAPATAVDGFDVAAENAQPGTHGWAITGNQFDGHTLAFADHVSVLPGEAFGLYVTCQAPSFDVRAYRIGDYGGVEARRVWFSEPMPCPHQPAADITTATRMRHAPWKRTLDVATTDWREGMYVLKVVAKGGSSTYVNIVLRSASARGRVLFVSSTQTFQAYNTWGGASAYRGKRGFVSRSLEVSYDRPQTWGEGSGKFLGYEAPLLMHAERLGLPLAYATDVDIATEPSIVDGALSIVTGGHAEYWTQKQRDALMKARSEGTNLLFFGANTSYWRVRLSDSALGRNRIMAIYKIEKLDPDTAQPSIRFRDVGQPDSELLGATYNCFPASGTFTIADAKSWVFAGTGVKDGQGFAGIIGPEVDYLAVPRSSVTLLANSPTKCGKHKTRASMTIMRDPSGAATVDVGTMGWVSKVLKGEAPASSVKFVETVTDNLLRASVKRGLG